MGLVEKAGFRSRSRSFTTRVRLPSASIPHVGMHLRFPGVALAALCFLAVSAPHARAQDLSLLYVHASSPNAELPAPAGFGVSGSVEAGDWLLRASFFRYGDETAKPGVVCRVYSPRIDCGPEEVRTSTSMGGLRLAGLRALRVAEPLRFALGAGVSFNAVSGSASGSSGRRADLHLPNGGQIGWLGLVALEIAPLASLPLRVRGSYGSHWLRFTGCVDDEDPTASTNVPFCGNERFDELSVGLTWDVSGMRGG